MTRQCNEHKHRWRLHYNPTFDFLQSFEAHQTPEAVCQFSRKESVVRIEISIKNTCFKPNVCMYRKSMSIKVLAISIAYEFRFQGSLFLTINGSQPSFSHLGGRLGHSVIFRHSGFVGTRLQICSNSKRYLVKLRHEHVNMFLVIFFNLLPVNEFWSV